jgi:photosystem II stability/assembly factor-like uncharacterized protein
MKKFYIFIVLLLTFCSELPAQWEYQYTGYLNTLHGVTFYKNRELGIAVGDQGRILKTIDGGYFWWSVYMNTERSFNIISFLDSNTILTAGYLGYFAKSTNAGETFFNLLTPTSMQVNGMSFINSTTGFVTGYSGLFMKTTNAGNNWVISWLPYTMHDMYMFDATTGIVCGSGGNILKTTNGGVNWTPRYSQPLQYNDLNGITFLNANTGIMVGTSGTILKTTDGGNHWVPALATPLTTNTLFRVSYPVANRITTIGGAGTIITSTDGGNNWELQYSGTLSILYGVYFRDANNGCVVGEGGIVLTTTDGGAVFVNNISTKTPDNYYLNQNYPNPFNPNTKIRFQIKESGLVTLKVYNLLGKEVVTIINGNMQPGTYETPFSGNGLNSGMYIYKLQAGNYTETKKMCLIK